MTVAEFTRATRTRDGMLAEIQRRRDWGMWTPTDMPAGEEIDLTERFMPRCDVTPEPPKLDREPESEFERQIAALLAEKPPEWLPYATWAAILGLWTFLVLAVCYAMGA